jgi:hypothetical protein
MSLKTKSALLCFGLVVADGRLPAPAQTPKRLAAAHDNSGLEAERKLQIESSVIPYLERDDRPDTTVNGRPVADLPPRTIVKLRLNPAKGTNINVEIWLPDPDQWNGRMVARGSYGTDGGIDPGGLWPFSSQGSFDHARGYLFRFDWGLPRKKTSDDINFAEDIDTYSAALCPYLNVENPDLSRFERRGGKLIVVAWASVPDELLCHHVENGKAVIEIPVFAYPRQTIWDVKTNSYQAVNGSRGGVERIADRF